MRRVWIGTAVMIAGALALTGCGRQEERADQASATQAAPAQPSLPADTALLGIFEAVSNTAMGVTGDITIDDAQIAFEQGHLYATQVVAHLEPTAPIEPGGAGLGMTLGLGAAQPVQTVEVRRIERADLAQTARNPGGLCGAQGATYLVLAVSPAVDGEQQSLWLAAFSGSDMPSGEAADSELCGTYLYMRDVAS